MVTRKFFKKTMVGMAALMTVTALAGCGKQAAAGDEASSTSSSTSVRSSESRATKAYRKANQLIKNGDYEGAYNQLDNLDEKNSQTDALMDDLQSYLDAKKSYGNGDYDHAANSLKTRKSNSSAMKNAFADLQDKVNDAKNTSSSTMSSQTSKKTTSQSSSVANQVASDATSDDVVNQFAAKMGFLGNKGYQIMPTAKNGNLYQFEIRQNNSDGSVASLIGIYQYNSKSGAVTKIA